MPTPRFASALSTDSSLAVASDRCVAEVCARLDGKRPDLLVAFATRGYGDGLVGLGRRLREASGASLVVGCTAAMVIEGAREVERGSALSVLGGSLPGTRLRAQHVTAQQWEERRWSFSGLPEPGNPRRASLLLLGDPFSFPMADYLRHLEEAAPGLVAAGGMASGGNGPGQHLLLEGGRVHTQGALAVTVEGDVGIEATVSQGCRPVGPPLVITDCRDHVLLRLGGKRAAQVMIRTFRDLPAADQELFRRGALLGIAVDPAKSSFEPSDLLVRQIAGLLPQDEAIAVHDSSIRRGMSVQFLVRDRASASAELERSLARHAARAGGVTGETGSLLFTCTGRGTNMFDRPHHDAEHVQETLGPRHPLAGFFAGGEVGPVGGRSFLHGFTASVATFRLRQGPERAGGAAGA